LTFLGAFGVVPQFVFTEADGTLSMFGVIACSIFAIIVVFNFAGFLLHNVNIKSMRSIEVKKRNDMIVFLQNQVSDYNKKINQLSKISKNGNDLIYKKALNICKQTTEATLKKLDQNIREKNEQLNKIAKYKDNEINNLKKTNLKLIAQKNALEKKMLHSQNQPMKKV
jgi:predicted  nucleic acid-binding Zn-ribbon protein